MLTQSNERKELIALIEALDDAAVNRLMDFAAGYEVGKSQAGQAPFLLTRKNKKKVKPWNKHEK